jgi:hypothetical protein
VIRDYIIYFIQTGGPHRIQNVGTWTRRKGLVVSQHRVCERRTNLIGVTLINMVLSWAPISFVYEFENGTIDGNGIFFEVYDVLRQVSKEPGGVTNIAVRKTKSTGYIGNK